MTITSVVKVLVMFMIQGLIRLPIHLMAESGGRPSMSSSLVWIFLKPLKPLPQFLTNMDYQTGNKL